MIGPIKGRLLEVCLFKSNTDMTNKELLKKFSLGSWSIQR